MFQIFLGAMDKESVRVVGGNKKGIIDASTLVYKYVFAAGAAADDFLSRGDLMRMAAAWEAVVKHFHEMPIEWIWCFDRPCAGKADLAAARTAEAQAASHRETTADKERRIEELGKVR